MKKKKMEFTVGGSVLGYFPKSLPYLGFVKLLWGRQIVYTFCWCSFFNW